MDDPRHVPLYSIPECARYLGLPVSTVRGWLTKPGSDRQADGKSRIIPSGSDPTALSFTNLLELFVLSSLRRNRETPSKELLRRILHASSNSDASELRNLSKADFCIERIEYDSHGYPIRFYPFTRGFGREDPILVAIDPFVKFGRPVIRGTGVTTNAVAKFVKAGDSILELADDYRVELAQIEEAVRYELAG